MPFLKDITKMCDLNTESETIMRVVYSAEEENCLSSSTKCLGD